MENWQRILYVGMNAIGPFASLYFISWLFIGNFVLLNLFLAILLDGFVEESKHEDEDSSDISEKEEHVKCETPKDFSTRAKTISQGNKIPKKKIKKRVKFLLYNYLIHSY